MPDAPSGRGRDTAPPPPPSLGGAVEPDLPGGLFVHRTASVRVAALVRPSFLVGGVPLGDVRRAAPVPLVAGARAGGGSSRP